MYYLCSLTGEKLCWFATKNELVTAWNDLQPTKELKLLDEPSDDDSDLYLKALIEV